MVEHVLTVACTVLELAEEFHKLRMHAVDAGIYYGALARLFDSSLYLTARFVNGFLNAGRMDAPVCNKLFQRYARNFTAYRIKAGKCDGFGRVVNDEVNARDCFKRTDITALAADNAAFHLIVRQRNNGNSRFRRMVGCTALNGSGNNLPCERIRRSSFCLYEIQWKSISEPFCNNLSLGRKGWNQGRNGQI